MRRPSDDEADAADEERSEPLDHGSPNDDEPAH